MSELALSDPKLAKFRWNGVAEDGFLRVLSPARLPEVELTDFFRELLPCVTGVLLVLANVEGALDWLAGCLRRKGAFAKFLSGAKKCSGSSSLVGPSICANTGVWLAFD